MKEVVGPYWGNLSYALGGWTDHKKVDSSLLDERKDKWKPSILMINITPQFAETTKYLSYIYNMEIITGPSLLGCS